MKKLQFTFALAVTVMLNSTAQYITSTGSLITARWRHESQLLNNGKVLIYGGDDGEFINTTYLKSAELYNPTTGTWSSTGNMNEARTNFASALLDNGNVLVMGGYNGTNWLNSCEIYDAGSGTWSFTDSLLIQMGDNKAVKLNNGKILVVNGNVCELYDQSTNTWSITDSLNVGRSNFSLVKLSDEKILAAGGYTTTAEIFDPTTETWTLISNNMVEYRKYHTSILMTNGKVLITGGNGGTMTSEVFDPSTNIFTASTNEMSISRSQCEMVNLTDGNVLIYGVSGFGFSKYNAAVYNSTTNEWYSPKNTTSIYGADSYSINKLLTGKILIAGGILSTGNGANWFAYLVDENEIPAPGTCNDGIQNQDETGIDCGGVCPTCPTGISQSLSINNNQLKIYPNPNTGEFRLEIEIPKSQNLQLNIFNILGQVVYTEILNNIKGNYKKQIDLKPNPTGIYNVQLLTDKSIINKKIIIE